MCIGPHVKYRYSCPILMKIESSRKIFEKNIQIPNFVKIRPVGAEVFHADGRTDMIEANSRFSKFCELA
jgi:hypothetical protein